MSGDVQVRFCEGLGVRFPGPTHLVLFGEDKAALGEMRLAIASFLNGPRLLIHPGKSRVYRVADGVPFLGWLVFAERMRLARGNVSRFRRRLRGLYGEFAEGRVVFLDLQTRVRAWVAHAAYGNTWRLRREVLGCYKLNVRAGGLVAPARVGS